MASASWATALKWPLLKSTPAQGLIQAECLAMLVLVVVCASYQPSPSADIVDRTRKFFDSWRNHIHCLICVAGPNTLNHHAL